VRPYLTDLLRRLTDTTPFTSSEESVSWSAHREAEQLEDLTIVNELASVAAKLPADQRRASYFVIGKIGARLGDEQCATVLLDLLPRERNKYNLDCLLTVLGEIPKGRDVDLSPVFALLGDQRWLVRHASIMALRRSASPLAEERLIEHLSGTSDPLDQGYCHSVLNEIGTPRAIPAIEANLGSRKRDVRISAQLALEAIAAREVS